MGARQAEQNEQPLTAEVQFTNISPCPVRVQHMSFVGVGYAGVADHLEACDHVPSIIICELFAQSINNPLDVGREGR